mmetsp:Transcript_34743/g.42709  ORF Transcript_34743/g.42709 Transcript_34743/m.42709 type:complete len:109 (+) Transcript_34743:119-445(+)
MQNSPFDFFYMDQTSEEDVWKKFREADLAGDIIVGGARPKDDPDQSHHSTLVMSHAFTVYKTVELSNGVRLVQVRNPWGRETYTGDWSDSSSLWTPELKKEAGYSDNT